MTRGALTTFLHRQRRRQYFAILFPALFISTYPPSARSTISSLRQSAILSAVIFNALVIIALIPRWR